MKTVRSLVKFQPDLLEKKSVISLAAPTKKVKALRARNTKTASNSLKASATAYVEHELETLQQTLHSETKDTDPWQHLLARRRILSLHPDCATSFEEPVSIAALLWSIEQVCILEQRVWQEWKSEFNCNHPHFEESLQATREEKFRQLLQPFVPLHGESQLVVAARSPKLRQGLCELLGSEKRLDTLRHQVASLPKKLWIKLLAKAKSKNKQTEKGLPCCSNAECRWHLRDPLGKQRSISIINRAGKTRNKRQKKSHREMDKSEIVNSASSSKSPQSLEFSVSNSHEHGALFTKAIPARLSGDSSTTSHPLETHSHLRSYLTTLCTLCGSTMSDPSPAASELGKDTIPATPSVAMTKEWKQTKRNEAVMRGLEATNQMICTALKGSRKSLGHAAVWHHLGDIIFLFRNLELLSANSKIQKTTREFILQWMSKWKSNRDLCVHDSMQAEILMGAAECLHARSELMTRGIVGDDEEERHDISEQIKALEGALSNHCFDDLIRYDPREMDGKSRFLEKDEVVRSAGRNFDAECLLTIAYISHQVEKAFLNYIYIVF